MKALVLKRYNEFAIDDIPVPLVGPQDVKIEVRACGICGSDVHGMDGSTGRRQPPIVMGHEAAGIITEIGSRVQDWKPGDRVTFDSTVYCGNCYFCQRGQVNLCDNRRVLGVSCDEFRQNGAFAEYVVVPQRILYRLPPSITFEQAAMTEALSIAVHAVSRSPLSLGDTAVVVGVGMIGLLIVQVLRARGCGKIIALDLAPARLKLAKKLGADEGLRADVAGVTEAVWGLCQNRGADVSFEVVGVEASLDASIACLRKGGTVTVVGNLAPSVNFPVQQMVTRQLRLIGSYASNGEYPICLDLISRGIVDVKSLISEVAPLEEGPEWFGRLYRRESGLMKVVLKP